MSVEVSKTDIGLNLVIRKRQDVVGQWITLESAKTLYADIGAIIAEHEEEQFKKECESL